MNDAPGARAPAGSWAGALRPSGSVLGLLLWAVLATCPAAAAATWQPGAEIVDGWVLQKQDRHSEYVRLTLTRGDEKAKAEITYSRGAEDAWSTRLYRVQPAPGGKLPAALAVALKRVLGELEQEPDHVPWVGDAKAPVPTGQAAAPRSSGYSVPYPPPQRWPLLALLVLTLALGLACAASLEPERRRLALRGVAVAAAAGVAVRLGLPVDAVPVEWLTVLHEGSVERIVATLYGNGNHGPLHDTMRWALAAETVIPLRGSVTLQVALGAANTVGFLVLARGVLGHWPLALLMTACFALNPLRVNGLLSELPSELLTTLTLVGCVAIAALPNRRWLGVLTLAAVTAAVAATRLEIAAIGALATVTALVPRWNRWLGVAAVLAGGCAWLLMPVVSPFRLEGLGLEALSLPLALVTGLPIGAVLLGLVGLARAALQPALFTLAALGLLPLFRLYWAAAHHGDASWEVMRYVTLLTPVFMATALLGWRPVVSRTPERWRRVVVVILAGACALPPPDALTRALTADRHTESPERLMTMPLTRLQQAEGRSLAATVEANPGCIVVSTSARDPERHVPIKAWDWILFGGDLTQPLSVPRDPPALAATLDRAVAGAPCVLFHRGIDCHIVGGPRCAEEVTGRAPLRWEAWSDLPYYDHVERRPEVRLELYQLRPQTRPGH